MTFDERVEKIVEGLKKYEPEQIILFGSAGRGDEDEYSDIDLVVIKETKESFTERLAAVVAYVHPSLFPVDIFVYTRDEFEGMKKDLNPFIEQVIKDGRVIYEKS